MLTRLCAVACVLVVAGSATAQGKFPTTAADMLKLKLMHYHTADGKYHPADFEWTFTETEFKLKKGKGAIPQHLTDWLFPAGTTADEITGKWALAGGRVTLTGIKAGDTAGKEKVEATFFTTAPSVMRVNVRDKEQVTFKIER